MIPYNYICRYMKCSAMTELRLTYVNHDLDTFCDVWSLLESYYVLRIDVGYDKLIVLGSHTWSSRDIWQQTWSECFCWSANLNIWSLFCCCNRMRVLSMAVVLCHCVLWWTRCVGFPNVGAVSAGLKDIIDIMLNSTWRGGGSDFS